MYRAMFNADDRKLARWLRDHPIDQAEVGPSLESAPTPSSSSTSPATAGMPASGPTVSTPVPQAPADSFRVFEDTDANDFSDVVTLLISHGVDEVDAQRFVVAVVKGHSPDSQKTGVVELYGRGGLTKAATRFKGLNVQGVEVLDLGNLRPDGEP